MERLSMLANEEADTTEIENDEEAQDNTTGKDSLSQPFGVADSDSKIVDHVCVLMEDIPSSQLEDVENVSVDNSEILDELLTVSDSNNSTPDDPESYPSGSREEEGSESIVDEIIYEENEDISRAEDDEQNQKPIAPSSSSSQPLPSTPIHHPNRPTNFPYSFDKSTNLSSRRHHDLYKTLNFGRKTPELVPRMMLDEFEVIDRSIEKRKLDIRELLKRIEQTKHQHRRFSENLQNAQQNVFPNV